MRFPTIVALALATVATPAFADDFAGLTKGSFSNPTPGSVTTGIGTNSITFGDESSFGTGPNTLIYSGSKFSGVLGTLNYFNGTTTVGTAPTSVDLGVDFMVDSPFSVTANNTFTLGLETTPNLGDADADADFVFLPTTFGSRDYTVNGQTYRLQLTGFSDVDGDGFLTSDSSQLHVREGGRASADLYAQIAAVPEPASWAMMILGAGMVGFSLRRRSKVTTQVAYAA